MAALNLKYVVDDGVHNWVDKLLPSIYFLSALVQTKYEDFFLGVFYAGSN